MTLTRTNVETILIKRTGNLLQEAGLDYIISGSNSDLNDPIGWAIRRLEGSVASVTSVADSDLSAIDTSDYDQLFDLAEYRTLENISGNLTYVDLTVGPRSERLGQLAEMVEKRLARKRKQLAEDYGFGTEAEDSGIIHLDYVT